MIVNGYSEQIDTRRMIADVDVNMAIPDILRQDLGSLGGVDPERAFVRTSQAGNADQQGNISASQRPTAGRKQQNCVRNCARGLPWKWMAEKNNSLLTPSR